MALPFLIGLLITLLFVLALREEEPVARLEVPRVGSGPKVPATESQPSSQPDSAPATDAPRVETELTENKTGPLRSELEGIAEAYPATYGVVIFDPSMPSSAIQSRLDSIFSQQERNQFGSRRYAVMFKPGTYANDVNVGFLPARDDLLAQVKPVFTSFPGWNSDTSGIRAAADLPPNARG